jgi:Rod binding domain-containing protein
MLDNSLSPVSGGLWLAGPQSGIQGPRSIPEAARQFEAMLVAHLLQTVREAAQDADPDHQDGLGGATYMEIAEQQLAQALADRGGFGIARLIERGLEGKSGKDLAVSADKDKEAKTGQGAP